MAAEVLSTSALIPNRFEPKRQNQWVLNIEGIDAFLLKTASQPSMEFEEVVMPFVNSKRYLAGMHSFKEMNVTLYDAIAPSGAQMVLEWIRSCYEAVSGRMGYADFYKRDTQLKLVDPIGTVVSLWDIKGAWVKSAEFGELAYEKADPIEIKIVIRYDAAILQF